MNTSDLNSEMAIDICVVIPAYNAGKFVCDALDSVVAQTRRPDEIIIVDDGSTDDTCELIKAWQKDNDLAVQVISQEHAGLPAARNTAIKRIHRGWVALLDADDIWCPGHLASLESAAIYFSDSILVFGDIYIFSENTVISEWFSKEKAVSCGVQKSEGDYYQLSSELYKSLLPGNYIVPSSLMFSYDAGVSVSFFDEHLRVMEDRDFLLRLSRRGSFIYTKKLTAGCREHNANITHEKNSLRNHYYSFRVLKKMLNNSCQMALGSSEEIATKEALFVTAGNLAYNASIKGIRFYVEALRFLFRHKMHKIVFNPKHLARALFFAVNGAANNG